MKLILKEIKEETSDVRSYIFESHEPVIWKPGQFLHYVLHHEPTDDRGSDRWFTISSSPSEGHIMLTTRFTSQNGSSFKHALHNLKIGEEIEFSDLDGDFTLNDMEQEYVFIAGGIGITPFRSIIHSLGSEGKTPRITLLYANRNDEFVFRDTLESYKNTNPNFFIHYIVSPEHIDEAKIQSAISDIHTPIYYTSGPEPMVDALNSMLESMGIAKDHIKGDWFPNYPAE